MRFEKYIPCAALQPYIESFAISESLQETSYKVLPAAGIVIGFQYKGRLSYLENENQISLYSAGITGIRDTYRIFQNTADTGTVLVFFKPGGLPMFFNDPAHELFGHSVSLDNLMLRSELLNLEERLMEAEADTDKIKIVEHFFLSRLRPVQPDRLVLAAITLICNSKGNIRIKKLADDLHVSQSPLEKRFRQAVGCSPKKFASIIRFKHILNNHSSSNSLTDLGYESGFYDQAHFIKEFKDFTGETPDLFFKK